LLQALEQRLAPATFAVTNVNDSGSGSLRDAITQANADAVADTIVFNTNPALGTNFSTAQTIPLTSNQLTISNPVTITGPGASLLTVRRDPAAATQFRIFNISSGAASSINVTLSGMTITGGKTSSGEGGAGVSTGNANVTITDSVITGNTAGTGGGISGTNTLLVENCTISGNTAAGYGGGISGGLLTVRNSTISGNTAGTGGGISGTNTLLVENCTISGNTSAGHGGGIYIVLYSDTSPTVRNSTISGNTAGDSGGGISERNGYTNLAILTVQNCTIANNAANGIGSNHGGGGIYGGGFNYVSLVSTIVANNNAVGTGPDVLGAVSASFSLIGTNPLLGPLANNGGPTQTMALLAGSPAIDKGSNPANLTTDQRGGTFPRVVGPSADIGAFEVQATSIGATISSAVVNAGQANLTQRSMVTSFTVTFGQLVAFNGAATNAFQLTPTGSTGSVTLNVDLTGSTATQTVAKLTFSGSLTEGPNSLIDGRYTLTVLSSGISTGLQGGDQTFNFFRLFGDFNGDREVNITDLTAFRNAFGATTTDANYQPFLDFNGDGVINITDLTQFRNRFGVILP
jgi:hypothetical protein